MMFSADETADVGIDLGTPVVEAIGAEAGSRFTGHIPKLTIAVRDAKPPTTANVDQAQQASH
jgi:arylsulfatase